MKKQNKFIEFLNSKGFYTALFTCLFAVLAIAAFVSIRNIGAITKLTENSAKSETDLAPYDQSLALDNQLATADVQHTRPVGELNRSNRTDEKTDEKNPIDEQARSDEKQNEAQNETKSEPENEQKFKVEEKPTATKEASEAKNEAEQKAEPKTEGQPTAKADTKTEPDTKQNTNPAEPQAKKEEPKQKEAELKTESASEQKTEEKKTEQEADKTTSKENDVGKATGFTAFADDDKMNWPLDGAVVMNFSIEHAIYDKTLEQYRTNPNICISAEPGTQVKAAAAGIVKSITQDPRSGQTVTVDHGNGWTTKYAQLQETILVKEGQSLTQGQALGGVGTPTKYGVLLGPHLEFSIAKDELPQDPQLVLAK